MAQAIDFSPDAPAINFTPDTPPISFTPDAPTPSFKPAFSLDRIAAEDAANAQMNAGQSDFTRALAQDLPSDVGRGMAAAGRGLYNTAGAYAFEGIGEPDLQVQQLEGQTNDQGQTPIEEGAASLPPAGRALAAGTKGLIQSAPQMAAVAGAQAVGIPAPLAAGAVFGATPQGFDPEQAAIGAVLPEVGKYTGAIAEAVAGKLGITSEAAKAVVNKLGGASGAAGLLGADQVAHIAQLPPEKRGDALVDAVGNVASMAWIGMIGEHGDTSTGNPVDPNASFSREKYSEAIEPPSTESNSQPPAATPPPPEAASPQEIASQVMTRRNLNSRHINILLQEPPAVQSAFLGIVGDDSPVGGDAGFQSSLARAREIANGRQQEATALPPEQPASGLTLAHINPQQNQTDKDGNPIIGVPAPIHPMVDPDLALPVGQSSAGSTIQDQLAAHEEAIKAMLAAQQPQVDFTPEETQERPAQTLDESKAPPVDFTPDNSTPEPDENQNTQPTPEDTAVPPATPDQEAPQAPGEETTVPGQPEPVGQVRTADDEEPAAGSSTAPAVSDFDRFADLKKQVGEAVANGKFPPPEVLREMEDIKNRQPKKGYPPEPVVDQSVNKPAGATEAPKPGEIVGMGGATEGEIKPTGPRETPGGEVHGVSADVLEKRRQAGVVEPIEPGKGIGAEESVNHGRELLKAGADPEKVMSDFEQTKKLSSEDMAIARAHGEVLAKAALDAFDKHGLDSPEYEKAWEADSAWSKRLKAMSTEWHKTGMAQQGETDIDTGTFNGLRKSYNESTDKDFTPDQKGTAQDIANRVKKKGDEANAAQDALKKHLVNQSVGPLDADAAAKASADKAVVDWAARRAELERKAMVAEAARKKAVAELNRATEEKAKASADKTVRRAAADKAIEEAKAAVRLAEAKKAQAEEARKANEKAGEAINKRARDAAAKAAAKERADNDDPVRRVWNKVRDYISRATDRGEQVGTFDELRHKVATDLGMKVDQVTRIMAQDKMGKFLANDAWTKQNAARQARQQAKQWVLDQAVPGYRRALAALPRLAFGLKVFGHGTVALGTHAPMVAFQPKFWGNYFGDFVKMYKMVGSTPYHEMQMQDLLRRPNYTTARRAGLVNDPMEREEYDAPGVLTKLAPKMGEFIQKASGMGARGYSVLKILRQDMFDQRWNALPKTQQIPEVAEAIADGINHATGVVKGKAPPGANVVLFAPRLEASRAAWLVADPLKAADTFADWKNAGSGDREFAVNQIKEKAWVLGTFAALLAANQGILSATGSKQKINMTDPMQSDFMKFKVAGMDFSYGNPMITMARLPIRLYAETAGTGGKMGKLIYPDEDVYNTLGEYARSQLSPFASVATDVGLRADFMNRQLPNSNRQEPKRLQAKGIKPYTWPEFISEQALPIPAEEAAREVWKNGMGMSDEQVKSMFKAAATIAVMSATGGRLTDDIQPKKKK